MSLYECGKCVACGQFCEKTLCGNHVKNFRFVSKYGFYALKQHKNISKGQNILFHVIRGLFKKSTYQEVIFEFNLFRRYDIVVPDLKLEIEFDGEQHFKFNKLFHGTVANFEESKLVDLQKEVTLRGYGYDIVRFSFIEKVDDKDYVRKKLELKRKING